LGLALGYIFCVYFVSAKPVAAGIFSWWQNRHCQKNPEKGSQGKESRSPPLKHTFSTEPSPESLEKGCWAS